MTITGIKVRKLIPEGRLKGVISATFDDSFAVHDIKVIEGDQRLFVAMPSRRDESGVFRDIVHPISREARQDMEQKILEAYRDAVREAADAANNGETDKSDAQTRQEREVLPHDVQSRAGHRPAAEPS